MKASGTCDWKHFFLPSKLDRNAQPTIWQYNHNKCTIAKMSAPAAATPNVTKTSYCTSQSKARLVVLNYKDYFELQVVQHEHDDDKDEQPTQP